MAILTAIISPQLFRYIERSKIAVDQYNVDILNNVTPAYYISNSLSNPFKDETKSNTELMEVLVSSGYLSSSIEPKSKNVTFIWLFDQEKWYLKLPDSFYVLSLLDGLSMSNYLLGAWNGSETYSGSAKDIIIPDSLNGTIITNIGQNAFRDTGLIAISFQKGSKIKQIHARAFLNNDLSSIVFPDTLERIDLLSFKDNNLTEITLPPSLKKIEQKAFEGNKDLNKITMGADSVEIGTLALGEHTDEFKAAYNVGGVGTYIWDGANWIKQ